MGKNISSFIIIALLLFAASLVRAQSLSPEPATEESLDRPKPTITLASGYPYIASLEYSSQLSNRFGVGFILVKVPGGEGIGVRVQGALYDNKRNFRLLARAPFFYYPTNSFAFCGKPWVFTFPTVNAEWTLPHGGTFTLGAGVAGVASVDHLLGDESEENEAMENTQDMNRVWHTVTAGISLPVTKEVVFNFELSAVMKNFKLAAWDEWVGRIPLIFVVGVSTPLR